jgi:hypothetical protein
MERLMEANSVASLMRRRERPKSITPRQVESAAGTERRGFSKALKVPVRTEICLRSLRSSQKREYSLPQARRTRLGQLAAAGNTDFRRTMPRPPQQFHAMPLLRSPKRRGAKVSETLAGSARKLSLRPRNGVLLRVSSSAGFRLPLMQLRQLPAVLFRRELRSQLINPPGQPLASAGAVRVAGGRWGTSETALYISAPLIQSHAAWIQQPDFRDISRLNAPAGALLPGTATARTARVPIELQAGLRYTTGTEEERG